MHPRVACLALSFAMLLGAACGGGGADDPLPIATGTLAGRIGGQSWSLVAAQTDAFLSDDQSFWVDAYGETMGACQGGPATAGYIILTVPRVPGDYAFSLTLNATFVIPGATTTENLVATRGRIRVDQVTATQITGGAHIIYDAGNTVDGQFQAAICP